jgi:hypothetical protein
MGIPLQIRYQGSKEKDHFYLRMAFSEDCYVNTDGGAFLPDDLYHYGWDVKDHPGENHPSLQQANDSA